MPNNNAVIEAFLNERANHLFREHERIAALRASVAGLTTIDDARTEAKSKLLRETLAENPDAYAHYDAALKALAEKEAQVLAANHIAPDAIAVHYLCDRCHDTGYVDGSPCTCLTNALHAAAFSRYDLTPQARAQNFDTFDLTVYDATPGANGRSIRDYMAALLARVKAYCDNFDAETENLLFSGSPGLGKTFLSNCVACDLIDKGCQVVYISAEHLIGLVRDSMRGGELRRVTDDLLACDLLIIDDLGAEYRTKFSDDQLFEIINSRILRGGKMIISSNLKLVDIQREYNKRLASRINGHFTVLPFQGEDVRNIIKKRRQRA